MKIILQKPHVTPIASYEAGEEIDVDEATYDWLMSIYMAERSQEAAVVAAFEKKLAPLKQGRKK